MIIFKKSSENEVKSTIIILSVKCLLLIILVKAQISKIGPCCCLCYESDRVLLQNFRIRLDLYSLYLKIVSHLFLNNFSDTDINWDLYSWSKSIIQSDPKNLKIDKKESGLYFLHLKTVSQFHFLYNFFLQRC